MSDERLSSVETKVALNAAAISTVADSVAVIAEKTSTGIFNIHAEIREAREATAAREAARESRADELALRTLEAETSLKITAQNAKIALDAVKAETALESAKGNTEVQKLTVNKIAAAVMALLTIVSIVATGTYAAATSYADAPTQVDTP